MLPGCECIFNDFPILENRTKNRTKDSRIVVQFYFKLVITLHNMISVEIFRIHYSKRSYDLASSYQGQLINSQKQHERTGG